MEIWKDIKGYEGIYEVSNFGRIKSLQRVDSLNRIVKTKILKGDVNNQGYLRVSLNKNLKMNKKHVHILVAIAFLNHVPNKYVLVVDHIDNIKINNTTDNLQLIPHRLNVSKDRINGSSLYTGVCWSKKMNKWVCGIKINKTRKHLGYFNNEEDASFAYQKALNSIS